MNQVGQRWAQIRDAVAAAASDAGRPEGAVRLVAVSKNHPAEAVLAAFEAGARDFGENYVQELAAKRQAVEEALGPRAAEIRWHFIGHLQSNKLRQLGPLHLLHSVDRPSLFKALARHDGPPIPALVQVRLGGEETKGGYDPGTVIGALREALDNPGVALRGLMTIPPPAHDEAAQRAHFETLAALLAQARQELGPPAQAMTELSMGMSDDFELAIAAGATLVRVGTAIFGARR